MDDPAGEIRAGAPRVPRVHRNRKEEEAHVRDVLVALGGSPEELDTYDPSDGSANLGSRVSAYTRLASTATTPRPAAAPPAVAPAPIATPRPERRRRPPRRERPALGATLGRSAVAAARVLARLALRVAHTLAHLLTRLVAVLRVAFTWLLPRARHSARLVAGLAVNGARKVAAWLPVAAAALRRSLPPVIAALRRFALAVSGAAAGLKPPRKPVRRRVAAEEPAHVADAVNAWVHPDPLPAPPPPKRRARERRAPRKPPISLAALQAVGAALKRPPKPARRKDEEYEPLHVADTVNAWVHPEPSGAPAVEAQTAVPPAAPPTEKRTGRELRVPRGRVVVLAVVIVAVVAAVLVPLQLRDGDGGGGTPSAASAAPEPAPVPTRRDFSDPRKYAAAMTRLALTSGRTEIDGDVTCAQGSTWETWTCRARGKPAFGAYAGRWLTYRCSPAATPQPGGQPNSVMINCAPAKPPAA